MHDHDLEYRVAELERTLHNIIRIGTVAEGDYTAAKVRVRSGDLLTGWRPWLTQRAMGDRSWWAPRVGEQVVLLSPSGDPAQGVVLPSLFQASATPPADTPDIGRNIYPDGAVTEYDCENHVLKAIIPGDIIAEATGKIRASASGDVAVLAGNVIDLTAQQIKLNGAILLNGPLVQGGGSNGGDAILNGTLHVIDQVTADVDVMASGISLVNHVHTETGTKTEKPE